MKLGQNSLLEIDGGVGGALLRNSFSSKSWHSKIEIKVAKRCLMTPLNDKFVLLRKNEIKVDLAKRCLLTQLKIGLAEGNIIVVFHMSKLIKKITAEKVLKTKTLNWTF